MELVNFVKLPTMRCANIVIAYFILFGVVLGFTVFYRYEPNDARTITGLSHREVKTPVDKFLGGLLSSDFDENSCLSRYQSASYHKYSPHKPSPYLISKLRSYENLHQRCGPNTESYKKATEQLNNTSSTSDCNYIVWIASSGLGNKMLTITSAFLYALLTNRILLLDQRKDMSELFCEPFPNTSWSLPSDFPIFDKFDKFRKGHEESFGNMVRNNMSSLPSYVYLHLEHDFTIFDQKFFCDDEQALVSKIPWLIYKSNNYFAPSLFSVDSFKSELSLMFPEKDTVFHHLGRYLFHPSDQVWGLITRFYKSYLERADERIGIQVRNFDRSGDPFEYVMEQILSCTRKEKLLPYIVISSVIPVVDVGCTNGNMSSSETSLLNDDTKHTYNIPKQKVVLVTSLTIAYSEYLKNMFWQNPTVTGDSVAVFQPSHEEIQQTDMQLHDKKALSEMYLLSLSDVLITSGWSTFGYVAQGLGGLRPWILYKPEKGKAPDPACVRLMSTEPCYHSPPLYKCGTESDGTKYFKQCEDRRVGVKLVGSDY